jgi:O-antigen biosynthesis protein
MSKLPAVTVIILNWNGGAYLPACLAALLGVDYPHYRVVVVDNGSSDGSPELVRRQFPQVELIENGCNRGFAAGNNVALRQLKTGYAVLLNPDVVVSPEWLRELIAPMVADPSIGIAGCKLTFPNGRIQHAGGFITAPQAFPGHYGLNEIDEGQHDSIRDVEYVTGAAMALARPLLNRIGLLDEGYFLYYEEVDFCWRARQAGFRVVYVPGATAVHDESALSRRGSPSYLEQMHSGRWRFLLKHSKLDNVWRETVPAEKAWLAMIGPVERLAMWHAYQKTAAGLAEIWRVRIRDGDSSMSNITEQQMEKVRQELASIEGITSQEESTSEPGAASLNLPEQPAIVVNALHEKWNVSEQPFTSHVPVIGRLITAVRTVWNNVSTKWYVRSVVQQQNEFNYLLVRALENHALMLQDHEQALQNQNQMLQDHEQALQNQNQMLQDHEQALQNQNQMLQDHEQALQNHAEALHQLPALTAQLRTFEAWLIQQDRASVDAVRDIGEITAQLMRINQQIRAFTERLQRCAEPDGRREVEKNA